MKHGIDQLLQKLSIQSILYRLLPVEIWHLLLRLIWQDNCYLLSPKFNYTTLSTISCPIYNEGMNCFQKLHDLFLWRRNKTHFENVQRAVCEEAEKEEYLNSIISVKLFQLTSYPLSIWKLPTLLRLICLVERQVHPGLCNHKLQPLPFQPQTFWNPRLSNHELFKDEVFNHGIFKTFCFLTSQLQKHGQFENSTNLITFNPMAPQSFFNAASKCVASKSTKELDVKFIFIKKARKVWKKNLPISFLELLSN